MNRSILILPGFLFLALLLTVAYAVLGLGGRESVLREAQRALDKKDYQTAVRLLTRVEQSAKANEGGLLEQALRMRMAAFEALDLREQALTDIATLFEKLAIQDRDLMCTRIRVLNEIAAESDTGDHLDRAARLCDRWIAKHPTDAVVLAEAGVNKAIAAARHLESMMQRIRVRTLVPRHAQILDVAKTAIYSIAGPNVWESQLRAVTKLLEDLSPGSSQEVTDWIHVTREIVLASRQLFVQSFATGDMQLTAYRGLARQLQFAGEDDTLLMTAHAFLKSAHARDALSAAVDIAEVHLRHERFEAAIEIAQRVAPIGNLERMFLAGDLDHNIVRLLLCRAIAYRAVKKPAEAQRVADDLLALLENEPGAVETLETAPWHHLLLGLLLENRSARRASLVRFVNSDPPKDYEWNPDLLRDTGYEALLEVCAKGEKPNIFKQWMRVSPTNPTVVHTYARAQIDAGDVEKLIPILVTAIRSLPQKDESLELLVEAQQIEYTGDLDAAIERAEKLTHLVPDEITAYPALAVAAARRALELEYYRIAMGCCAQARDLFPDARIPDYLEAEILLASGEHAAALSAAKLLMEADPSDQRALGILLRARGAAGMGTEDLRFESFLRGDPDLASTRFLAQAWLQRGEYDRVLMLTEEASRRHGIDLELQVLATEALLNQPPVDRKKLLIMLRVVNELAAKSQGTERERSLALWALSQYIALNPEEVPQGIRGAMLDRYLVENQSAKNLADLAARLQTEGQVEMAFRAYSALTSDPRYAEDRTSDHLINSGRLALFRARSKAEGFFRAALAFPNGAKASIDLALLAQIRGESFALPPGLPIDNMLAACVASRRAPVVEFLQSRLHVNPHDLQAQCGLAVLDKNARVTIRVRLVANRFGKRLTLLLALLQEKAYAHIAIQHAKSLLETLPNNEVLSVFLGRAFANAGEVVEMQRTLSRVGPVLLTDMTLTAEALDVVTSFDNPLVKTSKIMDQITSIVQSMGTSTPPALLNTLVKYNANALNNPLARKTLLPMIAVFWLTHPKLSGAGLREAKILADSGREANALRLLKLIEPDLPAADRNRFLEMYFSTAARHAKQATPAVVAEFAKEAIEVLQNESVHGAPLHFVLSLLDSEVAKLAGTPAGDAAVQRARQLESRYLGRHIDFFLAGNDANVENLAATLGRIGRRDGFRAGLERLDDVLRKDPSLLRIWLLRADWLVHLGNVDSAVASLEWLPRYLKEPVIVDRLIQLMGRSGFLVSKGKDMLKAPTLLQASKFSLGMVQLRLGTYLPAAQAIEAAEPREDGGHLYFRAMALVALHTDAGNALARELLSQLAVDYPRSDYVQSGSTVAAML